MKARDRKRAKARRGSNVRVGTPYVWVRREPITLRQALGMVLGMLFKRRYSAVATLYVEPYNDSGEMRVRVHEGWLAVGRTEES